MSTPQDRLADNVAVLASIGLPLATQPKHEPPEFPTDISSLSPLEISNLLVEYTAWYSFAASMEAYASAEESMLKGAMDSVASQAFLTSSLKTVEDRKMAKFNVDGYAQLNQDYLESSAKHELLKSQTSKFDKYLWVLSRVLTTLSAEDVRGKY